MSLNGTISMIGMIVFYGAVMFFLLRKVVKSDNEF